jgi:hypothetical protein
LFAVCDHVRWSPRLIHVVRAAPAACQRCTQTIRLKLAGAENCTHDKPAGPLDLDSSTRGAALHTQSIPVAHFTVGGIEPWESRVTLKFGPVAWHQGTPEIRQIGFRRPRYVRVALLVHAPGRPISMARQPAGQQGPGWGYGLLSPRISNQVISALPHVTGRAVALLLKSNQAGTGRPC